MTFPSLSCHLTGGQIFQDSYFLSKSAMYLAAVNGPVTTIHYDDLTATEEDKGVAGKALEQHRDLGSRMGRRAEGGGDVE